MPAGSDAGGSGDVCEGERTTFVRAVAAANQPRPPAHPVTIVEVGVGGADVRVPAVASLRSGWLVELGVDDDWCRCRVAWSRTGLGDELVASLEFIGAEPCFLTALVRWIESDREVASEAR